MLFKENVYTWRKHDSPITIAHLLSSAQVSQKISRPQKAWKITQYAKSWVWLWAYAIGVILHGLAYMGLVATKSDFRVSVKAWLKPFSSASETSLNIEVSLEASLDIILSSKRITKALISLRGCAGWSAPLLFATPQKTHFVATRPISFLCN